MGHDLVEQIRLDDLLIMLSRSVDAGCIGCAGGGVFAPRIHHQAISTLGLRVLISLVHSDRLPARVVGVRCG